MVRVRLLARRWRVWWSGACAVTIVGAALDMPRVADAGTLLLAALLVVLAWRGPGWWREMGKR